MTINRSPRYEVIRDEVRDQYVTPPADESDVYWFKEIAPQWRNRVGIPRLVADQASEEAAGLLRSINAGMFRNEPELLELLHDARESVEAFATALGRDSWRRFQGEGPTTKHEIGRQRDAV
ncbi:hypothetical protein [Streptomyces sp. AC495_CC817]|uniref:hypothetical protein n=1 Tax=Streptomyces sp. AC495_CC817 TaxID=2823900 RepID=UPI001C26BF1A|nr:hypothetical protein [Streptomyces sp. AC495_CC817]